ncbi:MAG: LysR family transcriptional regulator [Bacteriovorax sp.]|nr:LysR family transcriptional regulator [Rhizobacter sp.]
MSLTLRQLHIFTAVADAGSTTAAGLHVALSQSATSGALNELEALLGARLFDRVGKRLVLNDTGRTLLPQARALLDGARGIESQFGVGGTADKGTGTGVGVGLGVGIATHLRVGASTTIGNYLLPALVASYLRTSPTTGIDVIVGNTSDIAAAVARLEVDLGLIEGPCHEPELLARPWLEDELVIVCAPSHALVRDDLGARVGLRALRLQRWLLREPGSGTREAVEHALLPHLHQWVQPMQLGSTEAIKQAAAEGLGLTCLSLCAVQDLLSLQRLVVVNSTMPRLTRRLYLIQHRQKHFSASLQRFMAHCEAAQPKLFPALLE